MHKVFVAWDADEAKRFVKVLRDNGIQGRIIEDRGFPSRGVADEGEGAPEVWIADEAALAKALELAQGFESASRKPKEEPEPGPEPEGSA